MIEMLNRQLPVASLDVCVCLCVSAFPMVTDNAFCMCLYSAELAACEVY